MQTKAVPAPSVAIGSTAQNVPAALVLTDNPIQSALPGVATTPAMFGIVPARQFMAHTATLAAMESKIRVALPHTLA